jgi:hypothetical protein
MAYKGCVPVARPLGRSPGTKKYGNVKYGRVKYENEKYVKYVI